jgi:hypothetical protein
MRAFLEDRTKLVMLVAIVAIEPNIDWVGDPQARAARDEVALTVGADPQSYVLTTASDSGTTFAFDRDANVVVTRTCGPGCTCSRQPATASNTSSLMSKLA